MDSEWPKGDVEALASLMQRVGRTVNELGAATTWFRGQPKGSSTLVPSAFRELPFGWEAELTQRFRLGTPSRVQRFPAHEDQASWLCLMQHHRLPTRLLDWTQSLLVAAFFAVSSEERDEDAAIWCLNPGRLNATFATETTRGQEAIFLMSDEPVRPLVTEAFEPPDDERAQVLAVLGAEVDLRMLMQQAAFTIHGSKTPLEDMPGVADFLRKIEIPKVVRPGLARCLNWLGVGWASLFPDLDHLATEIHKRELAQVRRDASRRGDRQGEPGER